MNKHLLRVSLLLIACVTLIVVVPACTQEQSKPAETKRTVAAPSSSKSSSTPSISDIVVLNQGVSRSQDDAEMSKLCQDFQLDSEVVGNFYQYSKEVSEQELNMAYDILPCSANGEAVINGEKVEWKIRAGGTAVFVFPSGIINRVCENECCDKVKGVC